jgi:hypothetical protein
VKPVPSYDRLNQLLRYDPDTGLFWWRLPGPGRQFDRPAGTQHKRGYRQIRIDGFLYMAHRIAWVLVHGYWPIQLDHFNRDPSDNRVANLREATDQQNRANSKVRSDNICGIKGVRRRGSRWEAKIRIDGKLIRLGNFGTMNEAREAYFIAANHFFGEFARCA